MPTARDPRHRGRRTRPQQRPSGHLRTNYTENDFEAFSNDLERLYKSWPKGEKEKDRNAVNMMYIKQAAVVMAVIMVPVSVILIWSAIDGNMQWYWVPAVQSGGLLYFLLLYIVRRGDDTWYTTHFIYREAERRGISYKGRYSNDNVYYLMNKINADYNSRLWNRKFKWT